MNYIIILGKIATIFRSARLGWVLSIMRDSADWFWRWYGCLPLRVKVEGLTIGGFYRHRSFLAGLQGGYEPFTRYLFISSLRKGMTVVDGGAHIGLYSLIAARTLGGNGKVMSFEPDPYNFYALLLNLKENYCENVTALPKALSSQVGKTSFYQSFGTIGSSLLKRSELNPKEIKMIEVETTKVDWEVREKEVKDILVKLDLEGGEFLALEGMKETVRRVHSVTVFCELNPLSLAAGNFTPEDLVHKLQEMGLKVFFIDEKQRSLIPVDKLSVWQKGNLFGTKG